MFSIIKRHNMAIPYKSRYTELPSYYLNPFAKVPDPENTYVDNMQVYIEEEILFEGTYLIISLICYFLK